MLGQEDPIPAHLAGSLPDWMLDQIEASGGNAFDTLSLFECRAPVRRPTPMYDLSDEE